MRAIASDRQRRIDAAWVLFAVLNVAGGALLAAVARQRLSIDAMAAVPMLAALVAVMVWHMHRRSRAEGLIRITAERERDFVRDASHQLRTPITVARSHTELIRARSDDRQVIADADLVLEELGRLERLSDGLLMLASAEHPQFLERRPIDLARFVHCTAERWSVAAPRRWRVDVQARGTVSADPHRLAHVMDALVENALKATEPGGLIEFATRSSGGDTVIEVSDDGAGIDPAEHERIFDRFARAADGSGTGLGLPMVRAIAAAHGGTATVRSRPGHGASFVLTLPGFKPAARAAASPVRITPQPVT
jgi:signal transduction histidine kinase